MVAVIDYGVGNLFSLISLKSIFKLSAIFFDVTSKFSTRVAVFGFSKIQFKFLANLSTDFVVEII